MTTTEKKPKILLIDDDENLSQVLKDGLEARGFEVRTENDGRRALETVREFRPDLIVLDVVMPGTDGSEVAQDIRGHADVRDIPILFLSSLVSKTKTGKASPYLAKPISILDLAKRIEERLSTP